MITLNKNDGLHKGARNNNKNIGNSNTKGNLNLAIVCKKFKMQYRLQFGLYKQCYFVDNVLIL